MPPNPSRCAVSISCRSVSSVCSPSASHQRSSGRYSIAGEAMSRDEVVDGHGFSFERGSIRKSDAEMLRLMKRFNHG